MSLPRSGSLHRDRCPKSISPITLRMNIVSGESERIQIDLYGEDGRLLSRNLKQVRTSGDGVDQSIKIPFEIRGAAELGRVTVSTKDKAGRIQALNSVRVLLLSSGNNEINPPGNPSEPVGVFSPASKGCSFWRSPEHTRRCLAVQSSASHSRISGSGWQFHRPADSHCGGSQSRNCLRRPFPTK